MRTSNPNVRLASRYSHFLVTRGGIPCVLLQSPTIAPKGILLPIIDGEQPTQFMCNRENDRVPTIYARRRAMSAIERTHKFYIATSGSLVETLPVVQRLLQAKGDWAVKPVKVIPETAWIQITQAEASQMAALMKLSARRVEADAGEAATAEDKALYSSFDAFADKLLTPFTDQETITLINTHADAAIPCLPQ